MAFKRLIAAATSVAMLAAPTMAVAQRAATAPAPATQMVAPADETVEGSELRGGFVIPLIALIAVILGLCAAFCTNNDDDLPHSP